MGDRVQIFRHVCPRNCYNACGLLSLVEGGVIREIRGDAAHGYSHGRMCHLAYSYPELVYHPRRLLYPLRQQGRGTGSWRRTTWDRALELMAGKMADLKARYGSYLPVLFYTNSGNLGLLGQSLNWLADFLGDVTVTGGSLCWGAGLDAAYYDFGGYPPADPELMAEAGEIVIWGGNPAWTATLQMEFVNRAREKGAGLTVIDPLFTATAALADCYIQLNPGTDGALALAVLRLLWEEDRLDKTFLRGKAVGWEKFEPYLRDLSVEDLAGLCGVEPRAVRELADLYAGPRPVATWIGFGLQRHVNGGQNVRAIHALVALSGNLSPPGGLYYANDKTSLFSRPVEGAPAGRKPRALPVHDLAGALRRAHDPPVKMAVISRANPLSQNSDIHGLARALQEMELVVVVDYFLTPTARMADLVLPAAMFLEAWDVVPSYWHNWIGLNQPALPPRGEARPEIAVVSGLVRALRELDPALRPFPADRTEEEWLARLFNPRVYEALGIGHFRELLEGPRPLKQGWTAPREIKYYIYSVEARRRGLPGLPVLRPAPRGSSLYPYRLLTPHTTGGINSQFGEAREPAPLTAWVHPDLAAAKGWQPGRKVRIFNEWGEIRVLLAVSPVVPWDSVVCYQEPGRDGDLNSLVPPLATDMGHVSCGGPGVAYHDTFVNLQPL
ncbi:molybdopterin-dependent oxidoreductase [Thermanaeromonas sp. C210]|uniref:molybdopterin-dependent oxidoreductase n=1 Tax=Thermanaeromonas sp. C210 TaxID=2731925 RepID=UPI00155C7BDF|nr:molybdopterin-dependent oxidoreductase [Thermanaeromonas sp. C210]GFN22940.1 molybdopterin oxidoreductase [Thermanaeromonas sp. C210]